LPFGSRAELFYDPIQQAYGFATQGLDEELMPVCVSANEFVTKTMMSAKEDKQVLVKSGNLYEDANSCYEMCSSAKSLEKDREDEQRIYNTKKSEMSQRIATIRAQIVPLNQSRNTKSSNLGQSLKVLKKQRSAEISKQALQLKNFQIEKLEVLLGTKALKWKHNRGTMVSAVLKNDSDYALKSGRLTIDGYYKGKLIKSYDIKLPGYAQDIERKDSLGFELGYVAGPGQKVRLQHRIADFGGIAISTPSAKLLAKENGWVANLQGYLLPDELRVVSFGGQYVVPDKKGKRKNNAIVYSPEVVNFNDIVAARGLSQDAEIRRLKNQLNNMDLPESAEIAKLEQDIKGIETQIASAVESYKNSPIANNIRTIKEKEQICRSTRMQIEQLTEQTTLLSSAKQTLTECESGSMQANKVFQVIYDLNSNFGQEFNLPDIGGTFLLKSRELILKRLVNEAEYGVITDINGAFILPKSANRDKSMIYAPWHTNLEKGFWLQPLNKLGSSMDLNQNTSHTGNFDSLIENIVSRGCVDCSFEQFQKTIQIYGLSAPNAIQLKDTLSSQLGAVVEILEAKPNAAEAVDFTFEEIPQKEIACSI